MTAPLLFVSNLPPSGPLLLDAATEHHLRVRRQRNDGEKIILSDGTHYAHAHITTDKKKTWAHYSSYAPCPPNTSGLHLHLCVIKPEPLSWAVQKATEMGVASIQLLWADRCQRPYWSERSAEHLQKVMASAAAQSCQYHLPTMPPPCALEELSFTEEKLWVYADLPEHGSAPAPKPAPGQEVCYLIGPEGGWSVKDKQHLLTHAQPWSLPGPTLRAETAAVVCTALLRWHLI